MRAMSGVAIRCARRGAARREHDLIAADDHRGDVRPAQQRRARCRPASRRPRAHDAIERQQLGAVRETQLRHRGDAIERVAQRDRRRAHRDETVERRRPMFAACRGFV